MYSRHNINAMPVMTYHFISIHISTTLKYYPRG
ncbi:hypothetical protein XBO1_1690024 [Xenorhabdus bovienii str. oregonense]|uniref:Uncharacterized protein n=1 Tax=Xenorhabdus bovienii str. oregonense TaxID=1398202 RepID=A0A077P5D4_XENBV|nr:hypothetical protein XBO1_1690024 [Xenorhabdus bovienii str. oregonense]